MLSVLRVFYLSLFLLLSLSSAFAGQLKVLTEHSPPLSYENNRQVVGIATDLFLDICKEAGVDIGRDDVAIWPWARSYDEVKSHADVVLFSTARTPQREDLFQWVGPIINLRCTLVAKKRLHMKVDDIRKSVLEYRIGTVRESAPEQVLLKRGVSSKDLHRVHDMKLNIRKLEDGRIDALLFNEPAILHTIEEMGFDPTQYEVVYTLMQLPLYYAVSKKTDPALVQKLQNALEVLRQRGDVPQISMQ